MTIRAALPRAFDLSRASYYLDFVLVPSVSTALITVQLARGAGWVLAALVIGGAVLWSLAEYLIHRFAFHGALRSLHDVHHAHPRDLVGIASWGTFAAFALAWLSIYGISETSSANGVTAGILLGYLFYIVIHDRMHHGDRSRFGRYVAFMFRLHAGHHRGGEWNFGVSSPAWDIVFRTYRR